MVRKQNLTRRQADVLDFIRNYLAEHGLSPTLGEIGDTLGVNRVTVFEHVRALEGKGWLRTQRHLSRSIELLDEDDTGPDTGIPILGRISAGQPIEVVPDAERDVFTPSDFFPSDRDLFMLRVQGESMIEDHIRDGDLVIVESRPNAQPGDTVVALIRGEEATLKRFYPMGARVRLEPRNETMEPIVVPTRDVKIQGIVVGVLRKY
jgi:repressor LexA